MTPAESRLQLTGRGITGVPPDALSTVRTNAVSDAAPAGDEGSLPLVVLSPGFTNPRNTLTGLASKAAGSSDKTSTKPLSSDPGNKKERAPAEPTLKSRPEPDRYEISTSWTRANIAIFGVGARAADRATAGSVRGYPRGGTGIERGYQSTLGQGLISNRVTNLSFRFPI